MTAGETEVANTRLAVVAYARSFLGVPYVWGGNNRLQGLDCSGLVCEVLRSFGLVGPHEDMCAGALFTRLFKMALPFEVPKFQSFPPGTVLFFGKSIHEITHVALSVDYLRMIEAGGGGSHCTTKEQATRIGACVRERPVRTRSDLVAALLPAYSTVYG